MSVVAEKKRCLGCEEEFPATPEFFHRAKLGKYGLKPRCKECENKPRRAAYGNERRREKATIGKPLNCVACGIPIEQPKVGGVREFCSKACKKAGRAFCKACGEPITQPSDTRRQRRDFCNDLCSSRYRRVGEISSSWLEERNRTECKTCGKPIVQSKCGAIRKYCSKQCRWRYNYLGLDNKALGEEWGTFGPETQKSLREVQQLIGIGAAKRLATAIDREYLRRGNKKS